MICDDCLHADICENVTQGNCDWYMSEKEIRPTGEWEEPFEMNDKTYHKCTHCHVSSQVILVDKYCPNCGAKMKGGKTNG